MIQLLIAAATYLVAAAMTTVFAEEQLQYEQTLTTIATLATIATTTHLIYPNPFLAITIFATLFTPKPLRTALLGIITPFLAPGLAAPYLASQAPHTTTTTTTATYTTTFILTTTTILLT
jgi:hypothetical protein